MTLIVTTSAEGEGYGVLSNITEHIYIAEGVTRISTGLLTSGLLATGGGSVIDVLGSLVGLYNVGMILKDTNSADGSGAFGVTIGTPGSVIGFKGMTLSDPDNTVTNFGEILGESFAIENSGANFRLDNSGIISSATSDAVRSSGSGTTLVNYGTIQSLATAGFAAVNIFDNDASKSVSLTNYGTISGAGGVAMLGDLNDVDKLWNFGILDGDVLQGGGNDLFRNAGLANGDVDLGTGADLFKGWGGTVEGTIHGRDGNDTIAGGISDDRIFGDNGADVLKGGQGDDTLTGGAGRDLMRGGLGLDTFDFNKTSDSAAGAQRDHILDFSKADDIIDLAGIDAKTGVAGNQAFHFISTAFTGTQGELLSVNVGTGSKVLADVDGDGKADFSILVEDVHNLQAGDFIL